VLFKTTFDEARVTTCIKNVLQDITGMLRDGSTVQSTLTTTLTAVELIPEDGVSKAGSDEALRAAREINDVALSLFRQKPFMKKLNADIKKRGKAAAQQVVAHLEELRRALVSLSPPVVIQIGVPEGDGEDEDAAALIKELSDLLDMGRQQISGDAVSGAEKRGRRQSKRRRGENSKEECQKPETRTVPRDARILEGVKRRNVIERCVIVPVEGIDSSYVGQVVPCAVHKLDADFMPVYFLTELLSRSEGPLWVGIRGLGYAYHASLDFSTLTGQITFTLGECSAPAKALQAFHDIMQSVPEMLASADVDKALAETRASMLYSLHSLRATATSVMHQGMKSYFAGAQSPESDLDLETERVSAVGKDDLLRVWKAYFSVFLQKGVRCTSVASPGKLGAQVRSELEATLGVTPEIRSLDEVLIDE